MFGRAPWARRLDRATRSIGFARVEEPARGRYSRAERVAAALAPYDENTEVDAYVSESRDEILAEIAASDYEKDTRPTDPTELIRWWRGDHIQFNEDGDPLTTYNPDSKWDWWQIGGRWNGYWTFVSAESSAPVAGCRSWTNEHEDTPTLATNSGRVAEIAAETMRPTWAAVDLDGTWNEKAKMGWFGLSDATDDSEEAWRREYSKWIAALPKDTWIVLLDCHI